MIFSALKRKCVFSLKTTLYSLVLWKKLNFSSFPGFGTYLIWFYFLEIFFGFLDFSFFSVYFHDLQICNAVINLLFLDVYMCQENNYMQEYIMYIFKQSRGHINLLHTFSENICSQFSYIMWSKSANAGSITAHLGIVFSRCLSVSGKSSILTEVSQFMLPKNQSH